MKKATRGGEALADDNFVQALLIIKYFGQLRKPGAAP